MFDREKREDIIESFVSTVLLFITLYALVSIIKFILVICTANIGFLFTVLGFIAIWITMYQVQKKKKK